MPLMTPWTQSSAEMAVSAGASMECQYGVKPQACADLERDNAALSAKVEKLEKVRAAAALVRDRRCDYHTQGNREMALDTALAECEEVDRG